MIVPRLLFPSSPHSLSSPPSRCFATTADGRIALTNEWPQLFDRVASLPHVSLQTRHADARLIRLGPLPPLASTGDRLRSEYSEITFGYSQWSHACARIERCDCCDSPGRLYVHNFYGSDFLQISAPANASPSPWAEILADLVQGSPDQLPAEVSPNYPRHLLVSAKLSELTTSTATHRLAPALASWSDNDHALAVTLQTAAVIHTERFHARSIQSNHQALQLAGDGTTLQLKLDAVTQLAHGKDETSGFIHAIGSNQAILATFRPKVATPQEHDRWQAATDEIFQS